MTRVHGLGPALAVLVAVMVAGCGSESSPSQTHAVHLAAPRAAANVPTGRIPGFGRPMFPTPQPTGNAPRANAVKVIRGWSDALRRGDVRSAAGYFNLPSEVINGVGGGGVASLTIVRNLTQAETANAGLPCGAKFISADQRGRYTNALFRLTGRPGPGGTDCGTGVGETARTNFLIVNGRIVEWIRAPDDPGDNGSPTGPPGAPAPSGPPGSTHGAPVV